MFQEHRVLVFQERKVLVFQEHRDLVFQEHRGHVHKVLGVQEHKVLAREGFCITTKYSLGGGEQVPPAVLFFSKQGPFFT